jgi:malic enzyme
MNENKKINQKLKTNIIHHPYNFYEYQHLCSNILHNPHYNKGTAFTMKEREICKLQGLIPPCIENINIQRERAMLQLRSFHTPLEKYIYINNLRERNETLFYNILINNLEELLPIVYTPTVGETCIKFSQNWRVSQGMYITFNDMEKLPNILDNWPSPKINIIVVTDGSRILGLGDLGANGMGIPVGKLSLYIAAGGFHPYTTLPIVIDVGTDNEELLKDPLYIGSRHKRLNDEKYYQLMDKFLMSVKEKWPDAFVQFEDFSNNHCFDLLSKYREKLLCFNDDIQGTGAVIAAGFINAVKCIQVNLHEIRLVFFGAGSAGIGVADSIVRVMQEKGMSIEEGRKRFWFVDSKGLVTTNRGDILEKHKIPYARNDVIHQLTNLVDIIKFVKPHGIIGLSGISKAFTKEVIEELSKCSEHPIIFSLSNPTSKSECTAKEAYEWSNGKCIFASGSPFEPVIYNNKVYIPGQGNNMYIFPGLGFGAVLAKASKVSDGMIVAATKALADCVSDEEIKSGKIYPDISKIRDISAFISAAVMKKTFEENLSKRKNEPENLLEFVKSKMYQPQYLEIE